MTKDFRDEVLTNQLKEIVRKHFKKILDTYKYLSSTMGASISQINQNSLTSFINTCPDLVTHKYTIHEALIQESTVKGYDYDERIKNKNKNIPDNLVRHQFLYFLIKVATSKYLNQSNCNIL